MVRPESRFKWVEKWEGGEELCHFRSGGKEEESTKSVSRGRHEALLSFIFKYGQIKYMHTSKC